MSIFMLMEYLSSAVADSDMTGMHPVQLPTAVAGYDSDASSTRNPLQVSSAVLGQSSAISLLCTPAKCTIELRHL